MGPVLRAAHPARDRAAHGLDGGRHACAGRTELRRLGGSSQLCGAAGLCLSHRGRGVAATSKERRQAAEAERRDAAAELYATAAAQAWMDAQYGIGAVGRRPDLDRALVNPAAVFASPREVLHDPGLTLADKREVLRRWAWDAWLLELTAEEAMAAGEPSRYDEVRAALLALDRLERTPVVLVANPTGQQA